MNSFEDLQEAANDVQASVSQEQDTSFVHFNSGTGEEVWFEPVQQNEDGTQLYTDGQQLYQAVCVRVEDLVPNDAAFQLNVVTPDTFQSVATDATAFHSIASDCTFQHVPTEMPFQHQ